MFDSQLEKISKLIKKPLSMVVLGLGITLFSLGIVKPARADYTVKNLNQVQNGHYLVYEKDNSPVYYSGDDILVFSGVIDGKDSYERALDAANQFSKRLGGEGIKVISKGVVYTKSDTYSSITKQVQTYIREGKYAEGPVKKETLMDICRKNDMSEYKCFRVLWIMWQRGQL